MDQIIRKYDDIAVDFPVNGVAVPDIFTLLVWTPADVTVEVLVTLDPHADIQDGTAEWVSHETVAADSSFLWTAEYSVTGVKLVASGAGAKARIKS